MSTESGAQQRTSTPTAAPAGVAAAAMPDLQLLLDLPEEAVAGFKQAELLAGAARRPTTRKLRQVFWDTADHRLGRAGLAIAVQTTGQRRTQLLRNIKEAPTGGRILHQQDSPLSGDALDLTRLALLPGGDPALVARLGAEMLVPVFALDVARTAWSVDWSETGLIVRLDVGAIESPSGRLEFRQVALTPMSGPPEGLYDFARRLQRALPLRLATHDPVQQGYRLIAGVDWWPANRSGTAALEPGMTVRQGILAIGRAATAALRAELRSLEGTAEPDRIHDARVAIRRLRSALSVFRDALPGFSRRALARDLGALASKLGQARELDVFLAETLDPLTRASGDEACLRSLRLGAAHLREGAAEAARRAASAPDFAALSCRLAAWFDAGIWPEPAAAEAAERLDQSFAAYARTLLGKHHRKLVAAASALRDPQPVELHALRIQAKKLRYTAEFVGFLFADRPAKRYLSALKSIQDILGTMNDAVVARTLLPRITMSDPIDGARAAGMVTGWTAAEVTSAHGRFALIWKRFAETKRFWR
jgi:triphosphatase